MKYLTLSSYLLSASLCGNCCTEMKAYDPITEFCYKGRVFLKYKPSPTRDYVGISQFFGLDGLPVLCAEVDERRRGGQE